MISGQTPRDDSTEVAVEKIKVFAVKKDPIKKVTSASERMLIVTRAMVTMRLKKEDSKPNCTLVRASTMHGDEELALAAPGENYEDNGFLY